MNQTSIKVIKVLLTAITAVILFHVLVLLKIVPYTVAWGGQITNDAEMYVFESISISVLVFLVLILVMKAGWIKFRFKPKTINFILWLYSLLFVLNTIGNAFAKSNFEKLFAGITAAFAILLWLLIKPQNAG